jgi:hypothetical protein
MSQRQNRHRKRRARAAAKLINKFDGKVFAVFLPGVIQ